MISRRPPRFCSSGAEAAKSSVATSERIDCLFEAVPIEVGPPQIHEHEFGVGAAPEKEVAEAQLATGADNEIGVRGIRGPHQFRDKRLVDILRLEVSCLDPARYLP